MTEPTVPEDLDHLQRTTTRLAALKALHEEQVVAAMNRSDRNVSHIAKAAGMTRAGVHKMAQRSPRERL